MTFIKALGMSAAFLVAVAMFLFLAMWGGYLVMGLALLVTGSPAMGLGAIFLVAAWFLIACFIYSDVT